MAGTGTVALVTGAAGDIGLAIAAAFVRRGAAVVATDRDGADLERRVRAMPEGTAIDCRIADLTDPEAIAALVASAATAHGGVDVLVNNAAVQSDGGVEETSAADFDHAYAVNLRAPFLLARAVVPLMRARGGGAIVNIASVQALAPGPRRVAYATTKTALLGLTRSMAVDLGPHGIRVNAVCPSATRTAQLVHAWSNERAGARGITDLLGWTARQHPLGRLGDVADVAGAVVYLAEAPFVTGAELRVDGGLLAALRLLPP